MMRAEVEQIQREVKATHSELLSAQRRHLAAVDRAHWATFQHGVHDDALEAEIVRLAFARAAALARFQEARADWVEAGAPA